MAGMGVYMGVYKGESTFFQISIFSRKNKKNNDISWKFQNKFLILQQHLINDSFMATLTLNKLWDFIESLSLTKKDREWLIGKLQEPTFRVDPHEVSPSGDEFFADSRNVKAVEDDIAKAHRPDAKFTRLESKEDVISLINSL